MLIYTANGLKPFAVVLFRFYIALSTLNTVYRSFISLLYSVITRLKRYDFHIRFLRIL